MSRHTWSNTVVTIDPEPIAPPAAPRKPRKPRRSRWGGLPVSVKPETGICGRCRGKKFDLFTASRSSRKCPACKGTGSVRVGCTKR